MKVNELRRATCENEMNEHKTQHEPHDTTRQIRNRVPTRRQGIPLLSCHYIS